MAIAAGQFLHDVNGFVVDRIQTGGASGLNIPEEKINELGNFKSVATIRDIPDLSFDLESFDVSTEIEALLFGLDPATVTAGQEFDFEDSVPINVISPFKAAKGQFNIVRGLAIPYLTLESATYRMGNRQNATKAFTLRGDSIYYIPGSPYLQEYAAAGTTYAFDNTALPYTEKGDTIFALSVSILQADGICKRLFHGEDYTDTASGFTLTTAAPVGSTVRVVYGSAVEAEYPQTVHQDTSVKPAAVRGKDIDVYIGTAEATPVFSRWTGVQSFEVTRRVTLENDEEFGNPHYVSQTYDTPDVTGNITVRPADPDDLWEKVRQVTNVPTGEISGTGTSVSLPVEVRVSHPDTGVRLQTLYVPDARFTPPNLQGRVEQKVEPQFNFTSDGGTLLVYSGARP